MATTLPEGWHQTSTGGGCTALQRDLAGGAYALLTDGNQGAPERLDAPDLVLGLFTGRTDYYAGSVEGDLATCLAWLESRIAATLRAVDLHPETGAETLMWSGSFLDFLEGNADDGETCEKVTALDVGASVEVGDGAAVLTRVERLS